MIILNVFFCENMIRYVGNDAKKIWIFSVRDRSFIFGRIVCEQHITSDPLIQTSILLGARYLATSLHDPAIFVLLS